MLNSKCIPRLILVLLGSLLFIGPLQAQEVAPTDKTLSPYFFIRGGDESIDRLPLKSTEVEFHVAGVIVDVTVRQTYENAGTRPINAQYVFPASSRAAVHGLRMSVGGQVVEAEIREREQAKKEFEQAKKEGKSAALLEQSRPNVFRMSLSNVMPGDQIDVELQYTELLVPVEGLYEFVYPTVVGPRYTSSLEQLSPDRDGFVESPYLKEAEPTPATFTIHGNVAAGMPLFDIGSRTHELEVEWSRPDEAYLRLKEEEGEGGNRDFIVQYRLADQKIAGGLMLQEGESENFFLMMVEPPKRPGVEMIPPREYVFVVDVSGSMNGFPLETTKRLMRDLIGGLRPTDNFNVILFAGMSKIMSPTSLPASRQNLERALRVIDDQQGGGGTELMRALETAMTLPQDEGWSRNIVVVTDGYISCETDVFRHIRQNLGEANVFAFGIGSSVNRYLIEGIAKAGLGEPFVVTEPSGSERAVARFQKYIGTPLLTDIELVADGFEIYDVVPATIPDVLADRPVIVHGKWRGKMTGSLTLRGVSGEGPYNKTFRVAETPKSETGGVLAQLWARTRIADISDFNYGRFSAEEKAEVTTLGLTYKLMTRFTSFIAVHHEIRNPDGNAENVKQPIPLPEGVSNLAVQMGKGSEPSLLFLALMIVVLLFIARL